MINEIIKIVENRAHVPVSPLTSLQELGLDSLDMFEIMASVEEKFDVSISNYDMVSVDTVEDFVKMLERKVNNDPCSMD